MYKEFTMFEHRSQPMLPMPVFMRRMALHGFGASALVLASLILGILGYHGLEGLPWIDSLLNAAMILGGMGPVNPLQTAGGKIFASAYALFSGIIFLAASGLVFAPILHRFMHHFHLENESDQ